PVWATSSCAGRTGTENIPMNAVAVRTCTGIVTGLPNTTCVVVSLIAAFRKSDVRTPTMRTRSSSGGKRLGRSADVHLVGMRAHPRAVVERVEFAEVELVEFEVEDVDVLGDALLVHRLRDDDQPVL